MFEFLLTSAVVIAVLMAFFYFRTAGSDYSTIITTLEGLDKKRYEGEEGNEFECSLKHVIDEEDRILVYLPSAGDDAKHFGAVPYEYKGRILHFMNTDNLRCTGRFNKTTEKLTIELIDDLEVNN